MDKCISILRVLFGILNLNSNLDTTIYKQTVEILIWVCTVCLQEVFHVYLNKFEIALSHLFLIIFSNNKFTLVNQISRKAQSPRK